jgi:AraC-like DNA-binding protein
MAPSEYFQLRRVQHAGHLLLRSQFSVSEIAFRLGYADGAHLTRFFHKHQKCSPSEFRKRYRHEASNP